jgi:fatty-acyl-CoA synthase
LFSGGTTGTPKGVAYTQRALFLHTTLYSSNPSRPLNPGDRALILVPICHGLAWQLPHVSWLLGVDMVFIDGSLPGSAVFDAIVLTEATFAAGVPTVWHDVVGHARARSAQGIGSLRTVKLGGAMVPESLPHSLKELGVTTYVSWGLTETLPASMSLVASPRPEVSVEPDVRTSRPIPGAELRVIESENGEGGALEIRAPWITGAYVGRAAPMSEWFDTGDVGHVLETGQFTLSGRAKDMIKSGGETIWPGPIEAALLHHPHVTDAAVIEIPHERWGGQPLACVHVDGEVTPAELRTFLLSKLPKWQVPVAWVQVDRLPHTAIGKVDKRHLTKLVADGALMPDYAPY